MTAETLTRSFKPDLEIRSADAGGDGRTVVGIAVPYGLRQRINHELTEQFAVGSFAHQLDAANRVKVGREHIGLGGSLIGRAATLREEDHGLYAELRISPTPLGDETLALLRDGALTDLSIGFRPRQHRVLADGTVEYLRADLFEIAVVLEGAYGEAAVATAVRSERANLARAAALTARFPVLSI
jgi:HK97 family phage prohead protease